jgi:phosphohistidine phosphatase
MKTLLIFRHAKSSWSNTGLADHDRPLNKRGKGDAPRMGELLKEQDLVPDQIITSTAKRARTTAQLAAEGCGYDGDIMESRDFYHADPDDYIEFLSAYDLDAQIIMIVGHNPGMETLLYDLTGESAYLTTANLAHVQLPINAWRELDDRLEGQLIDLWRPKEL